jgi:type IV pilus assembly protein PilM
LKSKGGQAVLETYGELSLGPIAGLQNGELTNLPNDKLAQSLMEAIKSSEVTTNSAAISIPSAASLIFTVEIPALINEKDLPTIVSTEARKFIPVPVSEVTLDSWIIPRREEYTEEGELAKAQNKTEVLVAAIHNETISRYKEILKTSSVEADVFEIEVFSNIRSCFDNEISPVLLIDFGASKTKLAIVENGIVRVFHIINRGSVDISNGISKSMNLPFQKAEELKRSIGLLGAGNDKNISDIARLSIDFIFSETNSIILNYEKKYNKALSKVYLTGGGVLIKGMAEAAAAKFRSEVIIADPFSRTETPAFLAEILKGIGPEFSIATGLALRKLK